MLYIIMTTPLCNLKCSYCGGSLHGMPTDISYDDELLKKMIQKDPQAVVAFYGGEPLLRPKEIKHFLTILPAKHFIINTNGYFISEIEDELSQFDTILLSIDGRKEITDLYREKGCYDKVLAARDLIVDSTFNGELIARMAVSKNTDIYEDVTHLLQFFPYVHWQLDAIWSVLWSVSEFSSWVEHSYKPGLKRLINDWIQGFKDDYIFGIIPFLGIMTRLLFKEYNGLPCQAGTESISITTNGNILACPIAPDFKWNDLGSLSQGYHPIQISEPCPSCEVYRICGGRCMFTNKERLWGKQGFDALCDITKFLIWELEKNMPICEPIKEKIKYPPFNNTTEIIP
jgi:putative peptide-modifying radical SAM enzyme